MKRMCSVLLALLLLLSCGCAVESEEPIPSPEAPSASQDNAPSPGAPPAPLPENPREPEDGPEPSPEISVPASPPEAEMPEVLPEPEDSDFVKVTDYIPTIQVDLAYAGTDNFTGQVIYDFTDAYLRYGTVRKLAAVQAALAEQGLGLLLWDAFRPAAAQFKLWEVCPDPTYVANPEKGFSSHSRGNTVDVTLISLDGGAVEMPTGFDDFSPLADRDYSDVEPVPAANARLLEDAMSAAGFTPYFGEWWHFSDSDTYEVDTEFSP